MARTAREPNDSAAHSADTEQLRAKLEKARIDFINADLDAANTFIELAGFEFRSGDSEHGSRLVGHAERAAQVIKGLIEQLPDGQVPPLRSRLQALNQAIDAVKVDAS